MWDKVWVEAEGIHRKHHSRDGVSNLPCPFLCSAGTGPVGPVKGEAWEESWGRRCQEEVNWSLEKADNFSKGARASRDQRSQREGQGLGQLAQELCYGGKGTWLAADKALIPTSPRGSACYHHPQGLIFHGEQGLRSYPSVLSLCLRSILKVHTDTVHVGGCLCTGEFGVATLSAAWDFNNDALFFLQICLSLTSLYSLCNQQWDTGSPGCWGFLAGLLTSMGCTLYPSAAGSRLPVVTPAGQGLCFVQTWLQIPA